MQATRSTSRTIADRRPHTWSTGQSTAWRRMSRRMVTVVLFIVVVVGTITLAASLGPVRTPVAAVLSAALEPFSAPLQSMGLAVPATDPAHASVVSTVRLPRALLAALTGAALACAGVVMQAVFRNPLAEPGITGVSSGAAATAVILLVTGVAATAPWVLPIGAFLGALATVMVVQLVSGVARPGSSATLLLVGIALNALLGAVISASIANAADTAEVQQAIFWLNGDLTATTWSDVALVVGPVLVGLLILSCFPRELNLMVLSEEVASATGVSTARVRQLTLAVAALITAATVAVTGVISFVGLVVPHLVRLVLGPDHRRLLPASMAIGAVFLPAADMIARMVLTPVVLQTGVVTALVGAPVLLMLVLRRNTR